MKMAKKDTIDEDEMKEIDKTASKVPYKSGEGDTERTLAYRPKSEARGKITKPVAGESTADRVAKVSAKIPPRVKTGGGD
jgi:hypothetical protein